MASKLAEMRKVQKPRQLLQASTSWIWFEQWPHLMKIHNDLAKQKGTPLGCMFKQLLETSVEGTEDSSTSTSEKTQYDTSLLQRKGKEVLATDLAQMFQNNSNHGINVSKATN